VPFFKNYYFWNQRTAAFWVFEKFVESKNRDWFWLFSNTSKKRRASVVKEPAVF
jgi:hypothetical protein